MGTENYIDITGIDAVPPGRMETFQVAEQSVLICHTKKDGFFAVENLCSHAMAPLEGGRLRACRLICPLHGGSFDVRDGSAIGKPATAPIRTYPLRVQDDRIQILVGSD